MCQHVTEIVMGKDYRYCENASTHLILGVPLCDEHGDLDNADQVVAFPGSNVNVHRHVRGDVGTV